jgi:hypothetical protein
MEEEEVLEKRSTGLPALERAAKTLEARKGQPQKHRRALDVAASASVASGGGGEDDTELEEANKGLPLGWKARRSQNRAKGRIYWYHEGGTAGEPRWERPTA